jgi:hypothetical protein
MVAMVVQLGFLMLQVGENRAISALLAEFILDTGSNSLTRLISIPMGFNFDLGTTSCYLGGVQSPEVEEGGARWAGCQDWSWAEKWSSGPSRRRQ